MEAVDENGSVHLKPKRYPVYLEYNHSALVGHVELDANLSDEAIADSVLGPEIRLAADGQVRGVVAFGLFPRVNTDIRPRE